MMEIGKTNTSAAKIWMDLCALQEKHGPRVPIKGNGFSELAVLEKMGFIVTTETDGYVVVKVQGGELDEDCETFYCINRNEHDG